MAMEDDGVSGFLRQSANQFAPPSNRGNVNEDEDEHNDDDSNSNQNSQSDSFSQPPTKRARLDEDGKSVATNDGSALPVMSLRDSANMLRNSNAFANLTAEDLQSFLDQPGGNMFGLRDSNFYPPGINLRESTGVGLGLRDSTINNLSTMQSFQMPTPSSSSAGLAPGTDQNTILKNFMKSWETEGHSSGYSGMAEFLRSSGVIPRNESGGSSSSSSIFARDVQSVRPLSPSLASAGEELANSTSSISVSQSLSSSSHDPVSSLQFYTDERLGQGESCHPPWCPKYSWNLAPEAPGRLDFIETYFKGHIKKRMEELRVRQKNLQATPLDTNESHELEVIQTELKQAVRKCFFILESLLCGTVLAPRDLHRLCVLKRDIGIEERQLGLYISELQYLMNPGNTLPTWATLVVAKQPFPKPVKKNIKVCGADGAHEEPPLVRLLQTSRVEVTPVSNVKADVIYDDYHEREGTFTSDEQAMDSHGFASFYNLKFSKATRKKVARLQFSVTAEFVVDGGPNAITLPIQSEASAPFIVFTNESQWEESEAILLKKECFPTNEIQFQRFANYLQMHFLRSTRQDPYSPERALSIHDLNYIARSKFADKSIITKNDFDEFLKWFGKVLRKIRHQQTFHTLWAKGLVYGFISRQESEKLLKNYPDGTFLVRFSESAFGKVVITSVHDGEKRNSPREYHHFLISPGKHESPFRLLEVVRNQGKYKRTVVVSSEFDAAHEKSATSKDKDDVFQEHYLKKADTGNLDKHYILDDNEVS